MDKFDEFCNEIIQPIDEQINLALARLLSDPDADFDRIKAEAPQMYEDMANRLLRGAEYEFDGVTYVVEYVKVTSDSRTGEMYVDIGWEQIDDC